MTDLEPLLRRVLAERAADVELQPGLVQRVQAGAGAGPETRRRPGAARWGVVALATAATCTRCRRSRPARRRRCRRRYRPR